MSPFAQLAFLGMKGDFLKQNKIILSSSASVKCCSSFLLP